MSQNMIFVCINTLPHSHTCTLDFSLICNHDINKCRTLLFRRMRYLLSVSRARHAQPSNQPRACENSGLSRTIPYKLDNTKEQCCKNGTSSVAGLLEQINYIGGIVQLQRHLHVAASLHAQVIQQNLPVSVDEAKIRSVLKANNVAFELGFTCLIMDCIFCKHKKAGRKSDGEKMYVNIITGESLM